MFSIKKAPLSPPRRSRSGEGGGGSFLGTQADRGAHDPDRAIKHNASKDRRRGGAMFNPLGLDHVGPCAPEGPQPVTP